MFENKIVKKVLVITASPLKPNMSGPAIRALAISNKLSHNFEVTLVSTAENSLPENRFPVHYCDERLLKKLSSQSDAILVQGYTLSEFPWLANLDALLIADLYAPFQFEHLEDLRHVPVNNSNSEFSQTIAAITDQMRNADFFVCASERQRLFWLGHLIAAGRVSPELYSEDPTLRSLLGVVPFGIEPEFHSEKTGVIRNDYTGISQDDFVLFWGGGIYNWFDPVTLIKAVATLSIEFPQLKLLFLAGPHPDSSVDTPIRIKEAYEAASSLGILGSSIIFYDEWVPYEKRADFLSEVDMGVVTHFDSVETDLSYRTRLLDCIWASVPILSSKGDVFAEMVSNNGFGCVVETSDQESIEVAITAVLRDRSLVNAFSQNIEMSRSRFYWEETTKSLITYLSQKSFPRARQYRLNKIPSKYHRRNIVTSTVSGIRMKFKYGGLSAVFNRILEKFSLRKLKD